MKKLALVLAAAVLATACATSGKRPEVSHGMTKKEVYAKLGDPESIRKDGSREVLVYHYNDKAPNGAYVNHEYWVTLEDGKVAKYERADLPEN